MHVEGGAVFLLALGAQLDHLIDMVDGAFLGGAHHGHHGQDGVAFLDQAEGDFAHLGHVGAVVLVHRQRHDVFLADAQHVHRLHPRVMLGLRHQDLAQRALLDADAAAGQRAHFFEQTTLFQFVGQVQYRAGGQVQQFAFALAGHQVARFFMLGDGQRNGLQIARHPHAFIVGHGAAGGDVAPAALGVVAEHPAQIEAGFHFQLGGGGRGFVRAVVRVVHHGHHVGQVRHHQRVGIHVAQIARGEPGHRGVLQLGRQLAQDAFGAVQGLAEVGGVLLHRCHQRRVFRVEVGAPVQVLGDGVFHHFLEEHAVFGFGADEQSIDVERGRILAGHVGFTL